MASSGLSWALVQNQMNVLLLIAGDGCAEVEKWCGFALKSFDSAGGLVVVFILSHH